MSHKRVKPSLIIKKGGELSLSGGALAELLRAVLEKGVPFRFKAKGISMFPFLKDGDTITVYPTKGASPERGDVVAFINPSTEKLAVHRVVNKRKKCCLIKGDNLQGKDGMIPEASILGIVRKVERRGKNMYIGFGPEKSLIAFLSGSNIFSPLYLFLRQLLRSLTRGLQK